MARLTQLFGLQCHVLCRQCRLGVQLLRRGMERLTLQLAFSHHQGIARLQRQGATAADLAPLQLLPTRHQRGITFCCDISILRRQLIASDQLHGTTAVDSPRHRQLTLAADLQVAGTAAVTQPDLAVGIQGQLPLRCHRIGQVDPYPLLGRHQPDLAGIHAPHGSRVDGYFRHHTLTLLSTDLPRLPVDRVGPGDHVDFLAMQGTIELHRAGNQVDRRLTAAIQPLAPHRQRPLFHIQQLQLAMGIQHRLASGQRDIGGIDKATTITGQAVGVGHYHASLLTRHLQIAL